MKSEDFRKLLEEVHRKMVDLTMSKGEEYKQRDDNQFANFERIGKDLGLCREHVLMAYLQKHLNSITTWVKDTSVGHVQGYSEPIEGRIDDAILYLILLRGMVADRRRAAGAASAPGTVAGDGGSYDSRDPRAYGLPEDTMLLQGNEVGEVTGVREGLHGLEVMWKPYDGLARAAREFLGMRPPGGVEEERPATIDARVEDAEKAAKAQADFIRGVAYSGALTKDEAEKIAQEWRERYLGPNFEPPEVIDVSRFGMSRSALSRPVSIEELQRMVVDWANETFGSRTPAPAWMKFFEETGEVIKDPSDELEWADLYIMLLDLSAMHGIDVAAAVVKKLSINRSRKWSSEGGVFTHIKD